MDTWVGLSILIPCVGWMFVALFVLALVALLKNRPRPPQPVASRRMPSSSHPILRGLGLFALLVMAMVGLWLIAFVIYLAAERPGAPPPDAVAAALVGLVMVVGGVGGVRLFLRRPADPDQPRESAPGYRILVGGWVVGFLLAVGIPLAALVTGNPARMERLFFSIIGSCSAPILVVLILATVGRFAWMNRKRWAESLSYAHPTPPRVAVPVAAPLPSSAIQSVPGPAKTCPKCGATIAPDAAEGLCPRCLIRGALAISPNLSPTTTYGGFTPPTVEEVAEFFPQLEIHGLIGQGGMGAVYLATQKALDRPVALKIIRVREDDPTFEERFVREAKAMARLNHPNIVAIYDHGTAGGLPYLVLEYVDGVTLRDAMRAKRLTPAEALKIIPQVCDALEFAHSQGVVHRDVKPENILIDRAGRVKIADFGLAKVADPNGISLTHTRQAMGTPHYMAPEQWEHPTEVDHRADIYALGVVLYELLTSELPLGRFDPPSVKAAVDARIDELILRALAKEPDRRFQHATDVKLALAAIAASRFQSVYGHEYKSKWTLLGLPLVHIVRGRDPHTGRRKAAVGWLAIGDGSAIGGIAIGGTTAMGGVAIAGVASVGGIAIGGAGAMGVLALGGGWAVGGLFAAGGALATSAGLAIAGALALGKFAIAGAMANGSHRLSGNHQDADFGQRLQEWVETIWTDFLWPF